MTMGKTHHSWHVRPLQLQKSRQLSQKMGIPTAAAQVLINRGIEDEEEGWKFIHPDLSQLHSPFLLKGMREALETIRGQLLNGGKVALFGDYDVDGITATAILLLLFHKLGAEVTYYIPSRLDEGYGLNLSAVENLRKNGNSLLITVDCGINACEEVALAQKMGMEVVVTDHHHPAEALPKATAILNPHQQGCRYPFKELSGAGLAFKLAEALLSEEVLQANRPGGREGFTQNLLDLAALGTVADVVPLLDENRVLVAEGLKRMNLALRPGLKALCEEAGVQEGKLRARDLAFALAPRLNAAGRMGDAGIALELLLTEDSQKAAELARFLGRENSRRQDLEYKILEEALQVAEVRLSASPRLNSLVLAREGWHQGVLGIVASRMVDVFGMPVILIGLEGEAGRGSGRSAGGFNLADALEDCDDLLLAHGGHSAAAGLSIEKGQVPSFSERMDRLAGSYYGEKGPAADLYLDALLKPEEITPELARSLEMFEPFGFGNPRPLFCGDGWFLKGKRKVGRGGKHLRLLLEKGGHFFQGIGFDASKRLPGLNSLRRLSLAFTLSLDRWQGKEELQLEVSHFRYSDEIKGEGPLLLIDQRGFQFKEAYIREVVNEGEKVLVYVNTAGEARRLEERLKGFPQVFVSHQGRHFSVENEGKPAGNIVLYDVPWKEELLQQLLSSAAGSMKKRREADKENGVKIHLIFGEKDYYNNIKRSFSMLPTLCSVVQMYYTLHELMSGKSIPLGEVNALLKKRLPFPTTGHLIEKGMAILEEAFLVEVSRKELSVNGAYIDDYGSLLGNISVTSSYLAEKHKRERFLMWQEYLMYSEGSEVASFLRKCCSQVMEETR